MPGNGGRRAGTVPGTLLSALSLSQQQQRDRMPPGLLDSPLSSVLRPTEFSQSNRLSTPREKMDLTGAPPPPLPLPSLPSPSFLPLPGLPEHAPGL